MFGKNKHKEEQIESPFEIEYHINKPLTAREIYDKLQSMFDEKMIEFGDKYICHLKPFGVLGYNPHKADDDITGIDFIFYSKKGDFFYMNLFFEIEPKKATLKYIGKNTKSNKKECLDFAKEIFKILSDYKYFRYCRYRKK